ncbi:CNP1-like family protein [Undibacterium sp. TJN25]|uniref:CNP1-like family protein n=1 Tax=Undibacterium sp. TJN25 TaxID=3413056 RepID=UPI003BF22CF4
MLRKSLYLSALVAAACLSFQLPASAQQSPEDDEEMEKDWKEVAAQLPEAPKAENLISFYDSGTQAFSIDAKSLTIVSDGTIRYTLVAVSRGGAKNISYEAIRCESFEKKLYAFGRPDGSWSRSRRNEWTQISNLGANKQHSFLAVDYFCEGPTVAGKARDILDRIKKNQTVIKQY